MCFIVKNFVWKQKQGEEEALQDSWYKSIAIQAFCKNFSFFKSLYDPQNIKTAKVHCIEIEFISTLNTSTF